MTNLITIITNPAVNQDAYLVLLDGAVFTSHPTLRGAQKIAARLEAGWRP